MLQNKQMLENLNVFNSGAKIHVVFRNPPSFDGSGNLCFALLWAIFGFGITMLVVLQYLAGNTTVQNDSSNKKSKATVQNDSSNKKSILWAIYGFGIAMLVVLQNLAGNTTVQNDSSNKKSKATVQNDSSNKKSKATVQNDYADRKEKVQSDFELVGYENHYRRVLKLIIRMSKIWELCKEMTPKDTFLAFQRSEELRTEFANLYSQLEKEISLGGSAFDLESSLSCIDLNKQGILPKQLFIENDNLDIKPLRDFIGNNIKPANIEDVEIIVGRRGDAKLFIERRKVTVRFDPQEPFSIVSIKELKCLNIKKIHTYITPEQQKQLRKAYPEGELHIMGSILVKVKGTKNKRNQPSYVQRLFVYGQRSVLNNRTHKLVLGLDFLNPHLKRIEYTYDGKILTLRRMEEAEKMGNNYMWPNISKCHLPMTLGTGKGIKRVALDVFFNDRANATYVSKDYLELFKIVDRNKCRFNRKTEPKVLILLNEGGVIRQDVLQTRLPPGENMNFGEDILREYHAIIDFENEVLRMRQGWMDIKLPLCLRK